MDRLKAWGRGLHGWLPCHPLQRAHKVQQRTNELIPSCWREGIENAFLHGFRLWCYDSQHPATFISELDGVGARIFLCAATLQQPSPYQTTDHVCHGRAVDAGTVQQCPFGSSLHSADVTRRRRAGGASSPQLSSPLGRYPLLTGRLCGEGGQASDRGCWRCGVSWVVPRKMRQRTISCRPINRNAEEQQPTMDCTLWQTQC